MLVCLDCWEVLESRVMNLGFLNQLLCPRKSCGGQHVVDLDECLIPAIKELNEKGYPTQNCCSGHFWDGSPGSIFPADTYIQFYDAVEAKDFPNLPDGFTLEKDRIQRSVTIRKGYKIPDAKERHIAILRSAIDLTVWAMNLPECSEE